MTLKNDIFVYAKEYFHPFNPAPLQSKPLVVVGPSGVGKGTLLQAVIDKYGYLFERKISYTTRKPRANEKHAEGFKFVSEEEFQRLADADGFIEQKTRLQGDRYGTARAEIQRIKDGGKIPIIEVDVEGAIELNAQALEGNYLFIYPPSFDELRRRIGARIETEFEFKLRIADAIKQLEMANQSVLFTNRLVNDGLEATIDQFFTLVEALYF